MKDLLLRIFCLVVLSTLVACSGGSGEGGISGTGGVPSIHVNGAAEKGPFLKRSEVTYQYINTEGESISEDMSTQTTDSMGSFTLGLTNSGLVNIRVEGYHYNELNNQVSDGPLVLSALFEATDDENQHAYVNILTHLIHDRVLEIIQTTQISVNLAITQAEQELLTELDGTIPKIGISDFSQLSIYNSNSSSDQGNAYLLLLSAALYQHALNNTVSGSSQSGQLTQILNDLADDFVDGDLEASSDILDGLVLAIQQLDPQGVITNLENRSNEILGQTLEVADFTDFIGQFIITNPAAESELSDITTIRTEVPRGLKNVTLDLMVDGLVVDSITEAPYQFSWNPYYWSSESTTRHTLLVKARNSLGAEIISNLVPVSVVSNNTLAITYPQNNAIVRSIDEIDIQWSPLDDAVSYEYQINEEEIGLTEESSIKVPLPELGLYQVKVRAINAEGYTGSWSNINSFSLHPPEVAKITEPSIGQTYQNTNQVNLQWGVIDSATYYEYQLIGGEITSTENSSVQLILPSIGTYQARIRSVNAYGHTSDWSSLVSFSLLKPETTQITAPLNGQSFRNTNQVNLQWDVVESASYYEYQINGGEIISTENSSVQVSLSALGSYQVYVRSVNAYGHTSDWSSLVGFNLLRPENTQITAPLNNQLFQNTNQVNVQWDSIDNVSYYEYEVDGNGIIRADENQVILTELGLGEHNIRVRTVDILGFSSNWTSTRRFTIVAPTSPTISRTEVTETDDAFQLSVTVVNGLASNEVQVATDNLFTSSSIIDTNASSSAQVDTELVAGIYYIRARTINDYGHSSNWTAGQEVTVGMFAHAINMATAGWDDYDYPVALVFDEGSYVVAAKAGPLGDGSGDSFYLTKINNSGAKEWGVDLLSQARSPKVMKKTDSGYLIAAQGNNWRDAVILELNESGQIAWKETLRSETGILDEQETYTQEYIFDAEKVAEDEYILLGKYYNNKKTGEWSSELLETKNKITYLDRSGTELFKSEYEFQQPVSGEYLNINDLLLTENKLYAAGAYKASGSSGDSSDDNYVPVQGANGAVLFEINKLDGSIDNDNAQTASGLSNRYSGDVVMTTDGDIYVTYDDYNVAAASVFHSTGQSTDFVRAYGMEYGKTAADNKNNVYMAGSSVSDYLSSLLVRFTNGVEQARISLSKYSKDLSIKSISYDDKYGLIVLATDRGKFFGLDTYDSYTVIFNITDGLQYLAPSSLVTDYGQ